MKISLLNRKYLTIGILILLAIGFFYWFEIRPSQIREACHKEATKEAKETFKTKAEFNASYRDFAEKDMYIKDDYREGYNACLQSKGLEK